MVLVLLVLLVVLLQQGQLGCGSEHHVLYASYSTLVFQVEGLELPIAPAASSSACFRVWRQPAAAKSLADAPCPTPCKPHNLPSRTRTFTQTQSLQAMPSLPFLPSLSLCPPSSSWLSLPHLCQLLPPQQLLPPCAYASSPAASQPTRQAERA